MTLVKIINGVYGYRPPNSHCVIPVHASEQKIISVEDDEAKRLVEIGVAAYADAETPVEAVATAPSCDSDSCPIDNSPDSEDGENGDSAPGEIAGNFDPEELKGWKMDELKKLATDMGIDAAGIKKKDDLIAAIAAVEVTVPALETEDVVE